MAKLQEVTVLCLKYIKKSNMEVPEEIPVGEGTGCMETSARNSGERIYPIISAVHQDKRLLPAYLRKQVLFCRP